MTLNNKRKLTLLRTLVRLHGTRERRVVISIVRAGAGMLRDMKCDSRGKSNANIGGYQLKWCSIRITSEQLVDINNKLAVLGYVAKVYHKTSGKKKMPMPTRYLQVFRL